MDESHYIGQYDGYDLYWYIGRYNNGRIALEIYGKSLNSDGLEDFEPYAVVTVNLPNHNIPENAFSDSMGTDIHQEHAFIDHNLTEDFKRWLQDKGLISLPLRTVHNGYVDFELREILVKEQKGTNE